MTQPESRKTVRVFGAASFLNDFGSDMIAPIWPFFVTALGADKAMLGLIDGLGEALVSISQAVSGAWSDRIRKRKVFIWTGYLFGAISRLGYAVSHTWGMLIPFKILDRAGKMRGAPRDAIIADISTAGDRGRNFGVLRSMDNLGAVCGILFCMAFLHLGYTTLFLIAAVPSLLAVTLVLAAVRERPAPDQRTFKGVSFSGLGRGFWLFLFLNAVFSLGAFSYSFLMLYARDAGIPTALIPLLYLLFTLLAAFLSFPFGALSDRIGRKAVMMMAFALWGGVCILLVEERTILGVTAAFILFGLHKAALDPVQKAMVAELAPRELRASTLGGFQMVVGLCALPSSLAAGTLWDHVSPAAPPLASLLLTATAIVLLFFVPQQRAPGARS